MKGGKLFSKPKLIFLTKCETVCILQVLLTVKLTYSSFIMSNEEKKIQICHNYIGIFFGKKRKLATRILLAAKAASNSCTFTEVTITNILRQWASQRMEHSHAMHSLLGTEMKTS